MVKPIFLIFSVLSKYLEPTQWRRLNEQPNHHKKVHTSNMQRKRAQDLNKQVVSFVWISNFADVHLDSEIDFWKDVRRCWGPAGESQHGKKLLPTKLEVFRFLERDGFLNGFIQFVRSVLRCREQTPGIIGDVSSREFLLEFLHSRLFLHWNSTTRKSLIDERKFRNLISTLTRIHVPCCARLRPPQQVPRELPQ